MTLGRYIELLRGDSERIGEIADTVDLTTRVAACPAWTLGDLVYHVGEVQRFWCWVATERIQAIETDDDIPRGPDPDDADLADWFREGSAALVEALANADPTTPVWSWTPQHDMAFIQRRMPQEAAVHRWDAELAAGDTHPIATDLAADGIDEFFFLGANEPVSGTGRLGLSTTDTGDSWTASVDGDRLSLATGDPEGDAVLTGTASDLLLVLWRRLPLETVQVDGDPAAARAFLQLADLD